MKKILIFALFFLSVCHAQIVKDISVYRGDSTRIEFKANGNITAKGITFVVKLTKSFSSPRLIQKKNTIAGGSSSEIITSYSAPQTKVTVILGPEDTQDLTGTTYYYDIVAADAGALESYSTFNYGIFKVIQDIQTPFDGTDLPEDATRITTVSLSNGTIENEIVVWDTLLNKWVPSGDTAIGGSGSISFDSETYERYVGDADGKYPLTLNGLKDAINNLPNDSGVVWIAYPGVDTIGLGVVPPNVTLKGWYRSSTDGNVQTEMQGFTLSESNATSGILELTLDGDAAYNIPVYSGETQDEITQRIADSVNNRSDNWIAGSYIIYGECSHVNPLGSPSTDLFFESIARENKAAFVIDASGLNFDYFENYGGEGSSNCRHDAHDGIAPNLSVEILDSATITDRANINTLKSNTDDWHIYSGALYKIGRLDRQFYFNNGSYTDFWIGGFVTPPYNLPYGYQDVSYEYRTDFLNDTLGNYKSHFILTNIDGIGTPIWRPTYRAGFTGQSVAYGIGDLPDSVGLNWNVDDLTGMQVQLFDELNMTAGAKRFPMPIVGYKFRFGGNIVNYTFPYVYGYYSDFTLFGDQNRVNRGWHFYGKGDFPIYNDGAIQTSKYFEVVDSLTKATIYKLPETDGAIGQVLKTDGDGNITWQDDTGGLSSGEYITGSASISSISDSVIVNHVHAITGISDITVSPQSDLKGFNFWVSGQTDSSFQINVGETGYDSRDDAFGFSWQRLIQDTSVIDYYSGTATLPEALDSVIVTHGVGSTPDIAEISIIPQSDVQGFNYWISAVTSTTFKIKIGLTGYAPRSGDYLFSWQIKQ